MCFGGYKHLLQLISSLVCIVNSYSVTKQHVTVGVPLKSCKGIFDEDSSAPSGLYRIAPCGREFTVYCDMKEDGGGWTKIQQRVDNSTDFYRNRTEYVRGFGNFESNFWLGLDNIHCLTHNEPCELLVKISIFSGDTGKSKYQYFKVGNKDSDYQLHVRGYNKTVSDGGDALEVHNRQKFTTRDHDNDKSSSDNCAIKYRGAWWYNNCYESNLNGRYYNDDENTNASDGIIWYTFTGPGYSAKSVSMAVRCTC